MAQASNPTFLFQKGILKITHLLGSVRSFLHVFKGTGCNQLVDVLSHANQIMIVSMHQNNMYCCSGALSLLCFFADLTINFCLVDHSVLIIGNLVFEQKGTHISYFMVAIFRLAKQLPFVIDI